MGKNLQSEMNYRSVGKFGMSRYMEEEAWKHMRRTLARDGRLFSQLTRNLANGKVSLLQFL